MKAGHGAVLRSALADADPRTAAAEWRVLAPILDDLEGKAKVDPVRTLGQPTPLTSDVTMTRAKDRFGYSIRFEGAGADEKFIDAAMRELQKRLGKN